MPLLRNTSIASDILNNLMPGGNSSGNINSFAKKLINKSPLEIRDDDSAGDITNNPFEYGVVHYPEEVAQLGMGHYMIFDIIENDEQINFLPKNTKNLGNVLKNAEGRVLSNPVNLNINTPKNKPTHKRIASSIILYTPPNLKTTFATDYEQAITGLAGAFAMKGMNMEGKTIEMIQRAGREIIGAGLSVVPGIGDFGAVRTKVTGQAVNPNIETVFKSVPMREFTYVYDFAPKNKKELDMIQKILTLFKFHMSPDVTEDNNFLITPSEFNITYMYLGKQNNYIPRVARCVLKNMEIDQTPEGVISTFMPDDKGAFPTYTKVSLNFLETEIMTKRKFAKGF
jgi:hypothetical protein